LAALAESLAKGALIRDPSALERLRSAEVFVFDDGLDLKTREIEVAKVNVASRANAEEALILAAVALTGRDDPRARALKRELDNENAADASAHALRQRAGQTIFWTDSGAPVSVAAPDRALTEKFSASVPTLNLIRRLAGHPSSDPAERSLVVARDHKIIGVIQFARTGERRLAQIIAGLRRDNPEARFVHVSSIPQEEVEAATEGLGFDAVYGGLSASEKAATFHGLGVPAAWVGDGANLLAAPGRAASLVSISLSGLDSLPRDDADVVLLRDDVDAMLAPRRAAASHHRRLEADYRTVYVANLLAVAGGFAVGFGSLEAGLTSNVGSAAVFLGRWRTLAALAEGARRRAEGRRRASTALTAESALNKMSRRRVVGAVTQEF
jgi:cation transport ATPase